MTDYENPTNANSAKAMVFWRHIAQRTRVPAGTVLGVAFLLFMHPSSKSLWLGGVITACGALFRLWAAGHIEKGRVLTQWGPYALTRNPLYFGSFLMAIGIIIAGQEYWLLLAFGVFFVVFYYPSIRAEEEELLHGYGDKFREYAKQVPLFLPSIRKTTKGPSEFLWSRVVRNREHRTVAGLLVAETLLILFFFVRH